MKEKSKPAELTQKDKGPATLIIPPTRKETFEAVIAGDTWVAHRRTWKPEPEAETKAKGLAGIKMRGKANKVERDPEAEYNEARHRNPAGQDCIPAITIKKAMVQAWMGLLDFPGLIVKVGVRVLGDLIPIKFDGKKPIMRDDMVLVGPYKTPRIVYRPQYNNWSAVVSIEFDASLIVFEHVVELLNKAGSLGGGEQRPGKSGGNWGTWTVQSVTAHRSAPVIKAA